MSSFSAMESVAARESHLAFKQSSPCQAAYPHDPNTSVKRWAFGREVGEFRKDTPFHCFTNSNHHNRSALKPLLSLMGTLLEGG